MTISYNDMQNLVILTGNLAADAETQVINGVRLTKFRLATNESFKTKEGEWKKKATFHNIESWNVIAEKTQDYQKGDRIQVWGKLVSNQKSTSKGKDYYNTYVKAESVTNFSQHGRAEETAEAA